MVNVVYKLALGLEILMGLPVRIRSEASRRVAAKAFVVLWMLRMKIRFGRAVMSLNLRRDRARLIRNTSGLTGAPSAPSRRGLSTNL
jgi:hypothetical protein